MTTDLIAGTAAFTGGLVCLHLRRSPAALAIQVLLHLQATCLCARRSTRLGWGHARDTYAECYREVQRRAGR